MRQVRQVRQVFRDSCIVSKQNRLLVMKEEKGKKGKKECIRIHFWRSFNSWLTRLACLRQYKCMWIPKFTGVKSCLNVSHSNLVFIQHNDNHRHTHTPVLLKSPVSPVSPVSESLRQVSLLWCGCPPALAAHTNVVWE